MEEYEIAGDCGCFYVQGDDGRFYEYYNMFPPPGLKIYQVPLDYEEECQAIKVWSNKDPREVINKRGNIVVHAPENEVFFAEVEVHQDYCVFLGRDLDRKQLINEDDKWPEEWYWVRTRSM
jgi:hypothetical protein